MNSRKIIFLKFLLIMLKLNEIVKVMLCQCLYFFVFYFLFLFFYINAFYVMSRRSNLSYQSQTNQTKRQA